jgi:hypothetical protein
MAAPLYDVLLICHLASAFIGFGAVAIAGWSAAAGRQSERPWQDERLLRFFRLGRDWPSRLVLVVPAFGLSMLFGGDKGAVSAPWPWAGLFLWCVAVGHLLGLGWPAERRAQLALAASTEDGGASAAEFRAACRKMEWAAAVASVCFVLVVALMILQP